MHRPAETALEELVSLVKEYCDGEISWSTLENDHPPALTE